MLNLTEGASKKLGGEKSRKSTNSTTNLVSAMGNTAETERYENKESEETLVNQERSNFRESVGHQGSNDILKSRPLATEEGENITENNDKNQNFENDFEG